MANEDLQVGYEFDPGGKGRKQTSAAQQAVLDYQAALRKANGALEQLQDTTGKSTNQLRDDQLAAERAIRAVEKAFRDASEAGAKIGKASKNALADLKAGVTDAKVVAKGYSEALVKFQAEEVAKFKQYQQEKRAAYKAAQDYINQIAKAHTAAQIEHYKREEQAFLASIKRPQKTFLQYQKDKQRALREAEAAIVKSGRAFDKYGRVVETAHARSEKAAKREVTQLDRALITVRRLVTAWAVYGTVRVARETIETARAFERIENTLKATTGSAEGAAEAMDYIRRLSNKLGTDLEETAKQYGLFTASVEGSGLALNEQRYIFEAGAKAARVYGLSTENLQGVFTAFSQSISKGTIFQEELRQQLGDRLPGAVQKFADAIGVEQKELAKLVQQGVIPANEGLLLLARRLNETSDPGLAAALAGIDAQMVRLTNTTTQLKGSFGAGLFEGLGSGLGSVTQSVEELDSTAKEAGRDLGSLLNLFSALVTPLTRAVQATQTNLSLIFNSIIVGLGNAVGNVNLVQRGVDGLKRATGAQKELAEQLLVDFGLIEKKSEEAFDGAVVASERFEQALQKVQRAAGKDQAYSLGIAEKALTDYIRTLDEGNRKLIESGQASKDSFSQIGEYANLNATQVDEVRKRAKKLLEQYEQYGSVPPTFRAIADAFSVVSDATEKHQKQIETLRKNYKQTIFGFREDLDSYVEALQLTLEEQIKVGRLGPEALSKIRDEIIEIGRAQVQMNGTTNEAYQNLVRLAQDAGVAIDSLTETTKEQTKAERDSAKAVRDSEQANRQLLDSIRQIAKEREDAATKAVDAAAEAAARIKELESRPVNPDELVELNDLRDKQAGLEREARKAQEDSAAAADDLAEAETRLGDASGYAATKIQEGTSIFTDHAQAAIDAAAAVDKLAGTRQGGAGAQGIEEVGDAFSQAGDLIEGGFLKQNEEAVAGLTDASDAAKVLAVDIYDNNEATNYWTKALDESNAKLAEMYQATYNIGNVDLGGTFREWNAETEAIIDSTGTATRTATKFGDVLTTVGDDGLQVITNFSDQFGVLESEMANTEGRAYKVAEAWRKLNDEESTFAERVFAQQTLSDVDDVLGKMEGIASFSEQWGINLDGVKKLMADLNEEAEKLLAKLAGIQNSIGADDSEGTVN